MLRLAEGGVRTAVVRLPPIVHGDGDRGFVPRLMTAARKYGVSSYAGDGSNRWPSVHRLDAAHLFVRALEHGVGGSRYHGVAEEGIPFIDIATAIGERSELPVASATASEITKRFGFIAPFAGVDNPASSASTGSAGSPPTGGCWRICSRGAISCSSDGDVASLRALRPNVSS